MMISNVIVCYDFFEDEDRVNIFVAVWRGAKHTNYRNVTISSFRRILALQKICKMFVKLEDDVRGFRFSLRRDKPNG